MEQRRSPSGTSTVGEARFWLAATCVVIVFVINARYVLVDFTHGLGLLDVGWFAWIMSSGDPWLTNPQAIDTLTYFNYHLTPYLSVVSVVVHGTGLDRFLAFALHQGAIFALFAAGLFALVLTTWRDSRSIMLLAAVMIVAVLGDTTLMVASFPHPEPIILSFCVLGSACWLNTHRNWGALLFGLACLVREDGGLYAGTFLFALALLGAVNRRTPTSREAILGAGAVVVSLLMFVVKAEFFPGFSAFATNYEGDHWSHLSATNLQQRSVEFLANPRALTAIVPALLLGVLTSWRYLIFPVLMAPLIVAQLLAAREVLYGFQLYYAVPFLVIWSGLVVVAAYRSRHLLMHRVEPAILLASAILGSAPFLSTVLVSNSLPVATEAIIWPVADLGALSRAATDLTRGVPGVCISSSVAAFIPNDFPRDQILDSNLDVQRCKTVFLYNYDPHYGSLRWRLVFWQGGLHAPEHFERYDNPTASIAATRP